MEDALYTRVLQYLNIRPRSEKEIRDYIAKQLKKPKVRKLFERHSKQMRHTELVSASQEKREIADQARNDGEEFDDKLLVDRLVARLKTAKFLDDMQFALWFIRSRTTFKPKGKRLISLELMQKGIKKDLIDEAFASFDSAQEEISEPVRDEVSLAKALLEKKHKKYEGMERQERFNKAGSMLARRGFDLDTIKQAIDVVFGK